MTGLHPGATVTELVPGNPVDLDVLVARCGVVARDLWQENASAMFKLPAGSLPIADWGV